MSKVIQDVINFIKSSQQFLTRDIWRQDYSHLSRARKFLYQQFMISYLVIRSYVEDRLPVRASALVYSTLLSIVPLLAVTFSLFKGFGFHLKLEPKLQEWAAPLGAEALKTVHTIISDLDNLSLNTFGFIGLAILLISIFSIVNNIERAFNDIWRIQKVRSFHRRFADYAGVFLFVPILLIGVPFINGYLQSIPIVQAMRHMPGLEFLIRKATPLFIAWMTFSFLYIFVPNTKVQASAAVKGAFLAGLLWQFANYYFTKFIIDSYQTGFEAALYTSFASFLLFLSWLYLSWTVVLLGAEVSYAYQNQSKISWEVRKTKYSYAFREYLAILILLYVCDKFLNAEEAPMHEEIVDRFQVPDRLVNEVLSILTELHYLYAVGSEEREVRYTPGVSPDAVSIAEVMKRIRTFGVSTKDERKGDKFDSILKNIYDEYDVLLEKSFSNQSLKILLTEKESN
jgi:membrane protein